MKNIGVLFLLLFAFPLLTGMKVVYENETGKIVAIGPFTNYKLRDGQAIADSDTANPDQINTHLFKSGALVAKTSEEKQAEKDAADALKTERKTRKRAVLAKLNLTKSDIQALAELVSDGNDD